jgi:biopolymer transport protein ExbB
MTNNVGNISKKRLKKYFNMEIINSLKLGGGLIYPLSLLCIVALALIVDKIFLYKKSIILSKNLFNLIETYNFNWIEFELQLSRLSEKNYYRNFFEIILKNKNNPIWWLESRLADEAKIIEKNLNKTLWILETVVTVAPLLGLLGTIFGMMSSFKIIGETGGVVNPTGVSAGVAESLIATAFGLFIAIFSLFAFNFFSKKNDQVLDELERLGTRVVDHIKMDSK